MSEKDKVVYRKFLGDRDDYYVSVRSREYKAVDDDDYDFKRTRLVIDTSNIYGEGSEKIVLDYSLDKSDSVEKRRDDYAKALAELEILKFACNAAMDNLAGQLAAYEEEDPTAGDIAYDDDVPF